MLICFKRGEVIYKNYQICVLLTLAQCATMKLNKRSLPKPTTTTGWKLIPHRSKISMNWNPLHWDPIIPYNFKNKKFQKISDHSEIFFCFSIHKKLNKSCSLDKLFLFLKKKIVSLKKSSTLAKRHFLDFSWVFLTKWVDFLTFISRFACDESDFVKIFFFQTLPPRFFWKGKKPVKL